MKKLLTRLMLPVFAAMALALPVAAFVTVPAHAQCDSGVGEGIGLTDPNGACIEDNADEGFGALVRRIINIFSIVVGAISVIMIIIGGFRYVISGGDSNGVTGAKNTIMYAIIGLVIVIFAQVIIRFIFTQTQPQ